MYVCRVPEVKINVNRQVRGGQPSVIVQTKHSPSSLVPDIGIIIKQEEWDRGGPAQGASILTPTYLNDTL